MFFIPYHNKNQTVLLMNFMFMLNAIGQKKLLSSPKKNATLFTPHFDSDGKMQICRLIFRLRLACRIPDVRIFATTSSRVSCTKSGNRYIFSFCFAYCWYSVYFAQIIIQKIQFGQVMNEGSFGGSVRACK